MQVEVLASALNAFPLGLVEPFIRNTGSIGASYAKDVWLRAVNLGRATCQQKQGDQEHKC